MDTGFRAEVDVDGEAQTFELHQEDLGRYWWRSDPETFPVPARDTTEEAIEALFEYWPKAVLTDFEGNERDGIGEPCEKCEADDVVTLYDDCAGQWHCRGCFNWSH